MQLPASIRPALRLHGGDLRGVEVGQIGHPPRDRSPVGDGREAQGVDRVVRGEVPGKGPVLEDVALHAVEQEQGPAAAARGQLHEAACLAGADRRAASRATVVSASIRSAARRCPAAPP